MKYFIIFLLVFVGVTQIYAYYHKDDLKNYCLENLNETLVSSDDWKEETCEEILIKDYNYPKEYFRCIETFRKNKCKHLVPNPEYKR